MEFLREIKTSGMNDKYHKKEKERERK